MARYIDADKLTDKLEELQFNAPVMKMYTVIELVEDQPTADVVEVKHGEWEFISQRYPKRILRCSNCGYITEIDVGQVFPKLCEDCGAKMDGGKTE